MNRWIFLAFWVGLAVMATAAPAARAQPWAAEGYALVVGSNVGGRGQSPLRFAEADAKRVADVLVELGGLEAANVQRLLRPSAAELRAHIDHVREQIILLAQQGKQSRFYFYYSGHARADALNLGSEELPLSELRERLLGLPATLSIVVLDACQSGAFSHVKGAGPATDFSFNSVARLNTEGTAVIASSSERELSQESESLRSGYFTHHWLVALRGAGDGNGDGRVTLSEAYTYAYNHTLATTAETSIGEQHATLETNFKGKDDVPLTQPSAASAKLRILRPFQGRVIVQALPSWSVMAELDKTAGQPVVLALPAGRYAATLRRKSDAARCSLNLKDGAETVLATSQCEPLQLVQVEAKGGSPNAIGYALVPDGRDEGWFLELSLGIGSDSRNDPYARRLGDFALERKPETLPRFAVNAGRRLLPNLVVGLSYYNLEAAEYRRDLQFRQAFTWNAHALALFVQGDIGIGRRRMANLFARAGVGASLSWTSFDAVSVLPDFSSDDPAFENTNQRTSPVSQHFLRASGFLGFGFQYTPTRQFGFTTELRYAFAPALENEFGDVHDVGGLIATVGMRVRSWE